jgi:cephalosporin-C deacetylase
VPIFDYPLDRLREYRPPLTREPDFGKFWSETLGAARQIPLAPEVEAVDYPVDGLRVYRATYAGWDGARISGWYLAPEAASPLPALVVYHGYSGSKGAIYDLLGWAGQGYAVLAVDVRGQNGDTADPTDYPSGHFQGWMTLGVLDPARYFYRGVFVDCVRALDFVADRPEVDPERIGVTGISQGGGLTIAVAGLDRRPKVAIADVPFLCHYRRAVDVTEQRPYGELIEYCRSHPGAEEQVFRTLSYFDAMNMAPDVGCPTLVSVGLLDMICPPSTVFAAYNHLGSATPMGEATKEIKVYPFGVHAVHGNQWEEKLRWARRYLKTSGAADR